MSKSQLAQHLIGFSSCPQKVSVRSKSWDIIALAQNAARHCQLGCRNWLGQCSSQMHPPAWSGFKGP